MTAHHARIWVLITDGKGSRLCSCQNGMTAPITPPLFELDSRTSDSPDLSAYKAWFKTEPQGRLSQNPQRLHLSHVCQLLLEGARARAYDGLIIIAAAPVAAGLQEALPQEARALLIGKIVRDISSRDPQVTDERREIRH
jgi:hypothetical protein